MIKPTRNAPITEITLMGNEHFRVDIGRDFIVGQGIMWAVVVVCEDCGARFCQGWFKRLSVALREGNESVRVGLECDLIHTCGPTIIHNTRDIGRADYTN